MLASILAPGLRSASSTVPSPTVPSHPAELSTVSHSPARLSSCATSCAIRDNNPSCKSCSSCMYTALPLLRGDGLSSCGMGILDSSPLRVAPPRGDDALFPCRGDTRSIGRPVPSLCRSEGLRCNEDDLTRRLLGDAASTAVVPGATLTTSVARSRQVVLGVTCSNPLHSSIAIVYGAPRDVMSGSHRSSVP